MGRRRKINKLDTYRKKLQEGRCQGDKAAYSPGICTYEIPSRGKTARVPGLTTGRVHHCLSQHEKYFFLLLDYDPSVSDIKEQFLLPLDHTLLIAAQLKIKHPYADQVPATMSTDFHYCRNGKWYAAAIKTSEDLQKPRVQEKLRIEKTYWESQGVPWRVVTEKDIPRPLILNLQWLHSGKPIAELIPDRELLEHLSEAFLELFEDETVPFVRIIDTIEEYCSLIPGTVIQLFKQLVISGRIPLNLSQPIHISDPRKSAYLSNMRSEHGHIEGVV